MTNMLCLIAGLVLLTLGAELLVRGAAALARVMGLPSLIIGLTVVAYGTSAPELAVSIQASLANQADIAVGNVVGSNTFNVLLILGISALIAPLSVSSQLVRLDVPVMIGASGLTWLLATGGTLQRWEGVLLIALIVVYTVMLVWLGKKKSVDSTPTLNPQPKESKRSGITVSILFVLVGLGLLVLGADWLVRGAVNIAHALGVSELMIGLTLVAGGTSLPELATSVVASIRNQRDIAVGNVVGSNIFNLLAVLGSAAATSSHGVSIRATALHFDIPVMMAVALACLPVFFTGGRISRWEGAMFLGYYLAYIVYLVLYNAQHSALPAYSFAMLAFVLPGTMLGLSISCWNSLSSRRKHIPR